MSAYSKEMSKFKIARCVHGCNELRDASCIPCGLSLYVKPCSVKVACCMLGVGSFRRSWSFIFFMSERILHFKRARCAYGCNKLPGASRSFSFYMYDHILKFKIARCAYGCNELRDASCILVLLSLYVKLCSVKVACCMLGVASLRRSRSFICCFYEKQIPKWQGVFTAAVSSEAPPAFPAVCLCMRSNVL